jgi:hypothetical protein
MTRRVAPVNGRSQPRRVSPHLYSNTPLTFAGEFERTGNKHSMASRPEMREDDESGFCKFFRNLSHKDEDTVRIFDRGDYYSAHGEDAKLIADSVSIKLARYILQF